jgi:hypothetical protein
MVDEESPRRQARDSIPVLLKGIVCGFFSLVAWLMTRSDEVVGGARVGLYVLSAVSGLCAVIWLVSWIHFLALTITGDDGGRIPLGNDRDDDSEDESSGAFGLQDPMDLSSDDAEEEEEASEETTDAGRPLREQERPSGDPRFEVILGYIGDILSLFPLVFVIVTVTPSLIYWVTVSTAGAIGLVPDWEWNVARLIVFPALLFTLGFAWRWRSQLAETDGSHLRNIILLVGSAEIAAIGACFVLWVLGILVFILGKVVEIW